MRAEAACRITASVMQGTFGVVPNDAGDDTSGLQAAIDQVKAQCSPTGDFSRQSLIELPAGDLKVSRQLGLDADFLILRGAGSGAGGTRLVFTPDATTRYDTLSADGSRWDQDTMNYAEASGGWIWPGRGLLHVQSRTVPARYAVSYATAGPNRKDLFEGTVNNHWVSGLTLAEKPGDPGFSARKGDTVIHLAPGSAHTDLRPGAMVNVMAADSMKFLEATAAVPTPHPLTNQHMRQQVFTLVGNDPAAQTATIDKPLEYDVPVNSVSDGSPPIAAAVFDSKLNPLVDPVIGVGIENIAITQVQPGLTIEGARNNYGNMDPAGAMHGIVLKWAANSWVRNVRADMVGSHPIVTEVVKNVSILDNTLDGSWNKGKGGNGYLRGSRVWDSLYAGNTTRNLRHFTFQWSASGNVAIGNSFDSDINLHGGYERNNLIELNQVSVPYAHRPGNCASNCGDEGGSTPDGSNWYPLWWGAGQKAVKWSGATGPNNVFHNNTMRKQLGGDQGAYDTYAPYADPTRLYRFGVRADGGYQHLDRGGTPIPDWAGNETVDYTGGHGVEASRTTTQESIFLHTVDHAGDHEEGEVQEYSRIRGVPLSEAYASSPLTAPGASAPEASAPMVQDELAPSNEQFEAPVEAPDAGATAVPSAGPRYTYDVDSSAYAEDPQRLAAPSAQVVDEVTRTECEDQYMGRREGFYNEDYWFKNRFAGCHGEALALERVQCRASGCRVLALSYVKWVMTVNMLEKSQVTQVSHSIYGLRRVVGDPTPPTFTVNIATQCFTTVSGGTAACGSIQEQWDRTLGDWLAEDTVTSTFQSTGEDPQPPPSESPDQSVRDAAALVAAEKRTFYEFSIRASTTEVPNVGISESRLALLPMRCDMARTVHNAQYAGTTDCTFGQVAGNFRIDVSDPDVAESARFVHDALTDITKTKPGVADTYTPGLRAGPHAGPLSRLFHNKAAQDRNNVVAKRACIEHFGPEYRLRDEPDGNLNDCDEYPFRATRQGAGSVDPAGGSLRRFAVRAVRADHNQRLGSRLGAFMAADHLLDGDDFYVETYNP